MMKTIWKYELTHSVTEITVPRHTQWLDVQVQNQRMCAWALVDTEQDPSKVRLTIVGTGERFDPEGKTYIATYQLGMFVFHLFVEVLE